jgi:hypothetical protein
VVAHCDGDEIVLVRQGPSAYRLKARRPGAKGGPTRPVSDLFAAGSLFNSPRTDACQPLNFRLANCWQSNTFFTLEWRRGKYAAPADHPTRTVAASVSRKINEAIFRGSLLTERSLPANRWGPFRRENPSIVTRTGMWPDVVAVGARCRGRELYLQDMSGLCSCDASTSDCRDDNSWSGSGFTGAGGVWWNVVVATHGQLEDADIVASVFGNHLAAVGAGDCPELRFDVSVATCNSAPEAPDGPEHPDQLAAWKWSGRTYQEKPLKTDTSARSRPSPAPPSHAQEKR